jgi:hypothetical protein
MRYEREDVEAQSFGRLVVGSETRRNQDSPRTEINLSDTGLDQGEEKAGVQLQRVVRRARRDVGDDAEPSPSLLLYLEADELKDVVGAGFRLGQLGAGYLEPRTARDRAVEPDHQPHAGALALLHSDLLAARSEHRPGSEALRVLARSLDDERAVQPVRLPDDSHGDEIVSQRFPG